jgi:hypothetical protein
VIRRAGGVGFGERAIKRGPAMAADTEADHLVGVVDIRLSLEEIPLKPEGRRR